MVDVLCCQQGLQFIADRAGALAEFRRVLAPGGRLALAVWRGLDHSPFFAAFVTALARHAGEEAASSPLVGPVGALDEAARSALEATVVALAEPYTDDAGIAYPLQTWLVTAER